MTSPRRNATFTRSRSAWAGFLAGAVLFASAVFAADPGARFTYRGMPVEATNGLFVVTQDTNARETPDSNGKRRDLVEEGTKVRAFAKAGTGWLAVKVDDKEVGFLPANVLHLLFDGALESALSGTFKPGEGRTCSYTIQYTGNSPVEGELFETSDYDVNWRCTFESVAREFASFLFVTEWVEQGRTKPIYQVTNDIWEISGDAQDQVFSTTLMYDQQRGRLTFDSVSIAAFATSTPPAARSAPAIPDMLRQAVEMAAASWNADAWNAIGGIAK